MKNKILFGILLLSFICGQIWFAFISFEYPYLGIIVEKNNKSQWIIKELEGKSGSLRLDIQLGDIVKEVNQSDPSNYFSINNWRTIDQADTILLSRNGTNIKIDPQSLKTSVNFDHLLPLFGAIFGSTIAFLLYIRIRNSRSARYLSVVFLTIGSIYMSFGASIRGDILGKIVITSLMMLLPIIFLHFLLIFFKEKGNIKRV